MSRKLWLCRIVARKVTHHKSHPSDDLNRRLRGVHQLWSCLPKGDPAFILSRNTRKRGCFPFDVLCKSKNRILRNFKRHREMAVRGLITLSYNYNSRCESVRSWQKCIRYLHMHAKKNMQSPVRGIPVRAERYHWLECIDLRLELSPSQRLHRLALTSSLSA